MPELLLLAIFIGGLIAIELWYVLHGQATISEHAQNLNQRMDKQLLAGIFFGLGVLTGWFVAHFTS